MKHVAILIETSREYGRGLLRGIARYQKEHENWSTYFEPSGLGDSLPPWLKSWQGDGIIARIDNREMAAAVREKNVAVVNLRGVLADLEFPFIGSDNDAIGRLAARHFLERGFRNLAFCGFSPEVHPGFAERGRRFQASIADAGYRCEILTFPAIAKRRNWERQQATISNWLKDLAKPVGVMTANDDIGLQVLDACRRIGALVPEEIAVLGVDNDTYLCEMAIPSLSSIDINSEETGFRAAALLDRMMAGAKPPQRLPQTKPGDIVVRRSTDVLATNDAEVLKAAMFIRANAFRSVTVREVVGHVCVSQSSLSARFKSVLGKTMHEYIRQVQLDYAKELLLTTNLPVKQIAINAGFKSVHYFTREFSTLVGEAPASLRRRLRGERV